MSMPIRAPSTSPTSSSSHHDSKNLVNLLNLSRRGGLVNPAAAAAAAAAAIAAASANSGNGKDHNATIKKLPTATTIIHSDDEEMTFKQEPASPPHTATSRGSPPRANGKN